MPMIKGERSPANANCSRDLMPHEREIREHNMKVYENYPIGVALGKELDMLYASTRAPSGFVTIGRVPYQRTGETNKIRNAIRT